MKKLPFLLGLMMTFLLIQNTAKALTIEQTIKEWERAKAYTKQYLDVMPEDGYSFKPTPEIRSFAEQMLHLADANYGFSAMLSGIPSPIERGGAEKMADKSKAATTKMVMDSYDFVINALKSMDAAKMQEMVKFAGQDLSKEQGFAKCFEHQTHHRGQATVYIRLKGIKPPNEMLF
ncbi:Uncharacterized damage-inducible protein DinB (forms a four-helix bundle) [Pseudarcicella hirudinis]|uniref:Uncharacterized damage-inducible protein DinB (Forms a four-helix bundle) n=1 Tax=Pseudarcicella hirudinis TaxID=1079859 RepID=A0A1I5VDE8_9BACT|nr:DinB family protein [Pseudarcicella hirudinis]SFQ05500.1 Uncharacterized damage-inducible protein DinB (forms a four-helix bundle) [Pseudarcicella hirudinis]